METDWNVEDYRMSHETEDHWELRKRFMLIHKDKFPVDKLVCLAQVFSNVEFMGCRYPAKTMELVAELSQGIVEEYRNSRKFKLKRTFVTASDAAGEKVAGTKRPRDSQGTCESRPSTQESTSERPVIYNSQNSSNSPSVSYGPSISTVVQSQRNVSSLVTTPSSSTQSSSSSSYGNSSGNYGGVQTFNIDRSNVKSAKSKIPPGIEDFVIVQDERRNETHLEVLRRSALAGGFQFKAIASPHGNSFKCDILINSTVYTTVYGENRNLCREEGAKKALDMLRPSCYTIVVKNMFTGGDKVNKRHVPKGAAANPEHNKLNEDNVGNKLMRMMGWSGGGLGTSEQGIEEPVSMQHNVRRAGLGLHWKDISVKGKNKAKGWLLLKQFSHTITPPSEQEYVQRAELGLSSEISPPGPEFRAKITNFLKDYIKNVSGGKDLIFASEFTRQERIEIHRTACRLNLKSRTDKKQNFQLVISQKGGMKGVLAELMNGVSKDQYEVIPPEVGQ